MFRLIGIIAYYIGRRFNRAAIEAYARKVEATRFRHTRRAPGTRSVRETIDAARREDAKTYLARREASLHTYYVRRRELLPTFHYDAAAALYA